MTCASLKGFEQIRYRGAKHYTPKFKKLRREKFIKIDIPNLNEKSSDLSEDEMRAKMKERGMDPPRNVTSIQFLIQF